MIVETFIQFLLLSHQAGHQIKVEIIHTVKGSLTVTKWLNKMVKPASQGSKIHSSWYGGGMGSS